MKKSSLIVLCSLILALAVSFVPAIAYGNGLEASEEPTFVGVSEVVSEADDVAPTEVQTDVQTSPLEAEDAPQAADGGSKTEDVTSAPVFSGSAHVQRLGWIDATEGEDGTIVLGTTGQGLRVEAMRLRVSGGSVSYQAHVQSVGWDSWASDGELAGTEGEAKRLEGIKICLTGEVADAWSIQYRCHVQTYGWLGWAADGEIAGSTGFGKRLEAIEMRVVPAVRTHTRTQAGSIWGHVGIYVGDGWVMHSVTSGVVRVPLDYWIEFYGTTYTPKWGWLGGVKVA